MTQVGQLDLRGSGERQCCSTLRLGPQEDSVEVGESQVGVDSRAVNKTACLLGDAHFKGVSI